MFTSRNIIIASALITGMLNRKVSLSDLAILTGRSTSYIAQEIASRSLISDQTIQQRAQQANDDCCLAFDYVLNKHTGTCMEGVGSHYSSSDRNVVKAHRFGMTALVQYGQEPIPIDCQFQTCRFLGQETTNEEEIDELYLYRTPSEALIQQVDKLNCLNISFQGVVVDAEFTTNKVIHHFAQNNIGFLGRIRSNRIIEFEGQQMHIRDLANEISYMKCCPYPKLGWRAKKVKVTLDKREVNLIIIYRKKKGVWEAFFLVSLFDETVPLAKLLQIWKSRWGIEVIHRFLKQSLSFGKCRYKLIESHNNWVNLALDAFLAVVFEKKNGDFSSWREAQHIAAMKWLDDVLIDKNKRSRFLLVA